jgi:hypothetical protein
MLLEESIAEGYALKNLRSGIAATLRGGYEVRFVPKLVRVSANQWEERLVGTALSPLAAGKELGYYVYNTTVAARSAIITARKK